MKKNLGGGTKLNKTLNNEDGNKRGKIIKVLSFVIMLLMLFGSVSFAVWNYTYNGENVNSINTSEVSLEFLESNTDIISITNALPISDNEGKAQSDVFEFAVTSKAKKEMSIKYILNIEKISLQEGYTSLSDENVKIYLTDYNDNPLVGPVKISELDNYALYSKVHEHNKTNETLQEKYKLRVWIDGDTDASSWDENTKLSYQFKIGVTSTESIPNTVSVVVQNGVVEGESSKKVKPGGNASFNLIPNNSSDAGIVSCSSGKYKLQNNVLTVSEVNEDITCNVEYVGQSTVLYNDGTLIINELAKNRESNITNHGEVTNEYEPMNENNSYVFASSDLQPWFNERLSITSVEIGTEIAPISTAHWFGHLENMQQGNFTKLDTSNVTNMMGMFASAGESATFNIGDLSSWNTSQVTNMSYMFDHAGNSATTFNIGDLSNWNTSNVTNMCWMFHSAGQNATTFNIGDLSSWDTSQVEDMDGMFNYAGQNATTFNIGDLSSWNTSQVISMEGMFSGAGFNANWSLDCSKWNVNEVIIYTDFNSGVESKVTPPVWVH